MAEAIPVTDASWIITKSNSAAFFMVVLLEKSFLSVVEATPTSLVATALKRLGFGRPFRKSEQG